MLASQKKGTRHTPQTNDLLQQDVANLRNVAPPMARNITQYMAGKSTIDFDDVPSERNLFYNGFFGVSMNFPAIKWVSLEKIHILIFHMFPFAINFPYSPPIFL